MALRAVTSNGVAITPSSVSLPTGGTFDLYNTADQTTNYERLRADWSGNVARVYTQGGGTGSYRNLRVGVAATGSPQTYIDFAVSSPISYVAGGTAASAFHVFSAGAANSSGTQVGHQLNFTANQSGTAGYTASEINVTESATGSGTKLLQRWAVGGTALAQISSIGTLTSTDLSTANYLTFRGGSLSATQDVFLTRDAADTLAQRRTTNAQAFRVYKTYTDASNYERLDLTWSGSQAFIGVAYAGTGAGRELQFVSYGSAAFTLTATAHMAISAGTTARSQINFASSTAPTSPADGDLWFDGTNLKLRVSGTTYTLTKV